MTRLLRGRRSPAEPRHRTPRPGRHRAEHRTDRPADLGTEPGGRRHAGRHAGRHAASRVASRAARAGRPPGPVTRLGRPLRGPRHRVRYAAAGLLALSGAVVGPVLRPAAAPAELVAIRPLAVRAPAAAAQPFRRVTPRRPHHRWVTRTVDGAVLRGRATWYGPGFAGRRTASGEVFQPHAALTAAHRTLPFGTRLRVCHAARCVVVRVNDRGPFGNAILDLSWLAAHRIGLETPGIAPVTATILLTRRERVAA